MANSAAGTRAATGATFPTFPVATAGPGAGACAAGASGAGCQLGGAAASASCSCRPARVIAAATPPRLERSGPGGREEARARSAATAVLPAVACKASRLFTSSPTGAPSLPLRSGCPPVGEDREGQPARVEHLALQASHLVEEPAQQVGRQRALTAGRRANGLHQVLRGRLVAPQDSARARFEGAEQAGVVHPGDDQDHPFEAPALECPDRLGSLFVHLVGDDQGDGAGIELAFVHDLEPMVGPKLAGNPCPGDWVGRGDEDVDALREYGRSCCDHPAIPSLLQAAPPGWATRPSRIPPLVSRLPLSGHSTRT